MFIQKYKNLANFLTCTARTVAGIFLSAVGYSDTVNPLEILLQKSTISSLFAFPRLKIVLIRFEKVLQNGTYMAWMVLRGSKKAFRINGLRGKNVG